MKPTYGGETNQRHGVVDLHGAACGNDYSDETTIHRGIKAEANGETEESALGDRHVLRKDK